MFVLSFRKHQLCSRTNFFTSISLRSSFLLSKQWCLSAQGQRTLRHVPGRIHNGSYWRWKEFHYISLLWCWHFLFLVWISCEQHKPTSSCLRVWHMCTNSCPHTFSCDSASMILLLKAKHWISTPLEGMVTIITCLAIGLYIFTCSFNVAYRFSLPGQCLCSPGKQNCIWKVLGWYMSTSRALKWTLTKRQMLASIWTETRQ